MASRQPGRASVTGLAIFIAVLVANGLQPGVGLPPTVLVALAAACITRAAQDALEAQAVARRTAAVAATGAGFLIGAGPAGALLAHGGTGAAAIALASAGLLLAARSAHSPGLRDPGLLLTLAAGLTIVAPVAAALLTPLTLVLGVRALRRGARWPVFAPAIYAAGLAVGLGITAAAGHGAGPVLAEGLGLSSARHTLSAVDGVTLAGTGTWLARIPDRVGVVAALLALVGLGRLLWRDPIRGGMVLWTGVVGVLLSAGLAHDDAGLAARGLVVFALAAPVALGIAHLAARLGRAELPAAVTLAVIASAEPLFTVFSL